MATVTTTTATGGAFGFPPQSAMDLNKVTGHLWMVVRTSANVFTLFKSIDAGASWSSMGTFSDTGVYDLGDMRIDPSGQQMFITYLVNNGTLDIVYFKRVDISSGSPSFGGVTVAMSGNSTTARSFYYSSSLVPIRNPDGSWYVVIGSCFHQSTYSGAYFVVEQITNATNFPTVQNNSLIIPAREFKLAGDDSGGMTISLDLEHNGDGITSTTPNIWGSMQIHDKLYVQKFTWKGVKNGWASGSPPGILLASGQTTVRDVPGKWDGERFIILSRRPSDQTKYDVYERNRANTSTTIRQTPSHPGGTIGSGTLSYNHVTKDFRIFAQSTTANSTVYYVDYFRATNTWGSWTAVGFSSGPVTAEFGARRNTAGIFQYDLYGQPQGTGTPWTVQSLIQTVNFAPTAPTWVTGVAGTVENNGSAFDVSSNLLLDWVFNDPNSADIQGRYALSRQIGSGTVQWWRASDSTWQTTETINTSGTTQLTLTPAQWLGSGGASDPAHGYQVKTWDSSGVPSPTYSATLAVKPSTRVDPTLTTPTAGAILNSGVVSVAWTVSDQSAYRVKVTNTATSKVDSDSGWVADPGGLTTSYVTPVIFADGYAGRVDLQTRNSAGLASVVRQAAFTIDFVEPVAPVVTTLAAAPTLGGIQVALTQAAATGTQPGTMNLTLWRRKAVSGTTAPVNTNPYFETDTSDWQINQSSYASAARSTSFAHTGSASVLLTPNGTSALPYYQSITRYATTAGTLWEARGWLRSTTANKPMRIKLQWYDSGNNFISDTYRDLTPVAGVWVYAWVQGTAPETTTSVRIAVGQTSTPAAGDTLYADELGLYQGNSDTGIVLVDGASSGTTYLDWKAITGVNYEYRGTATATNGTSIVGAWQS